MIFRCPRGARTGRHIQRVNEQILGAPNPQVFEQQAQPFAKAPKCGVPFAPAAHFGTKFTP